VYQRRRTALARVEAAQEEARRALQARLASSQRMESIGRLAGGVAHDFNNLLTVILGCAESPRERSDVHDRSTVEELDEILAANDRARDLTGQLLAFARKQVIAPVALDVNAVVRQGQRMLARLLGEDVQLEVDLQEALWPVRA
jgi:two-component system, cell cycle sensor histidine kinase and response regulator CckA